MKTLLLALLLFIGTALKAQTYQADSVQYYSNVFFGPDTTLLGDINISIDKSIITIINDSFHFNAKIIDTLPRTKTGKYSYRDTYLIQSLKDSTLIMELYMSYTDEKLIVLGISADYELLMYYIRTQLIETNARHPYFRDWLREALSESL